MRRLSMAAWAPCLQISSLCWDYVTCDLHVKYIYRCQRGESLSTRLESNLINEIRPYLVFITRNPKTLENVITGPAPLSHAGCHAPHFQIMDSTTILDRILTFHVAESRPGRFLTDIWCLFHDFSSLYLPEVTKGVFCWHLTRPVLPGWHLDTTL